MRDMRFFGPGLLLGTAAVWCAGGCSDAQKRMWRPRSAQDNYAAALDASNADQRREAVARIAESHYVESQDAFDVLDAVARTDPVSQIRCIALRALAGYRDGRPVPTLLAVLQARPGSDEALPGDEHVRWEAVRALNALTRRGVLTEPQRQAATVLLTGMLETENDRQARIAVIEGLGLHRDRRVLTPLIGSLRNEDFAIADAAERSLIALTGVTHDYDADAWARWVAEASDPFEKAGQVPVTTRPAGPTWWDKQTRAWKRALKLGGRD